MALLGTPTPGLVPVMTAAGTVMMAPEMAAEVQSYGAPYVDPVLGDPAAVAGGGVPPQPTPVPEAPPSHIPPNRFDELYAVKPEREKATASAAELAAPVAQQQATEGPQVSAAQEQFAQLLANPPDTNSSSTTRRTTVPFSGPNRQAYEQAQDESLAAQTKAAQATGAIADMTTQQAMLEASQAQDMVRADQARRLKQDALIAEARQKRDAAFAKIPDKLDPKRWDKTGGPAQILGAIGVMLGGISQGITGRANPGKAIMDTVVQDDLEQQRAEIELAKQDAGRADNELQDLLDTYGDPILAEKALQMDSYGAILKELQGHLQAAQGEVAKQTVAQAIAEFQADRAQKAQEFDGRLGEIVTSSQTNPELDVALYKTRLGAAGDEVARESDPLAGLKESDKNAVRQVQVIMPDGTVKYAKDKDRATKAEEVFSSYKRGYQLLDELEKIARTPGSSMSPEQRAKAEQAEGELAKVVGSLLAPGEALSDAERKFYASIAVSSAAGADAFGTVEPLINQARNMFLQRANLATSGSLYDDWQRTKPAKGFASADPRVRKAGY